MHKFGNIDPVYTPQPDQDKRAAESKPPTPKELDRGLARDMVDAVESRRAKPKTRS